MAVVLVGNAMFLLFMSFPVTILTSKVELRLDGLTPNQGCVQLRRKSSQAWRPVCEDVQFKENEAAVVCRQLGYNKVTRKAFKLNTGIFILFGVKCNGTENNISSCYNDGFEDSICISDHCAGVCCSNSSQFGEQLGDIFVSHCGANWTEAQGVCDERSSTIATLENYQQHRHKTQYDLNYWTGGFFTPWIWSNGCYNRLADFNGNVQTSLSHNSPQLCLQLCGIEAGTVFALSGRTCRCLQPSHHWSQQTLTPVAPGECKRRCAGNLEQYCGGSHEQYWNLYSVASEGKLFILQNSPAPHTHRQCAILQSSKVLRSEDCDNFHGYICSDFNNGSTKYIDNMFMVTKTTANHECRNDSEWRLAGIHILDNQNQYFKVDNRWVDIERTLVMLYDVSDYKVQTLEPTYCQSGRKTESGFSKTLLECKTRSNFLCMKKKQPVTTVPDENYYSYITASTTRPDDYMTQTIHVDPDVGDTTSDEKVIVRVSIIVVSTVLAVLVMIVIVIWWHRRISNRNKPQGCEQVQCAVMHREIDAAANGNGNMTVYASLQCEEESHYEEIKDHNDTVYNEIHEAHKATPANKETETNITDCNSDDTKDPLMVKVSYTYPQDKLEKRDKASRSKSSNINTTPTYMFPYDSLKTGQTDMADFPSQTKETHS